jgi:pyrroline-5-carboxylate reductase
MTVMSHANLRIGLIGGGNMGYAIVAGLLRAGHRPECIAAADPDEGQRRRLANLSPALRIGADNLAAAADAEVLVLAVKPQALKEVVTGLASAPPRPGRLWMSVAAGVALSSIAGWLKTDAALVRVMPNQPALIGEGISVLVAAERVTADQRARADYIAGSTGKAVWIADESLMDAVTALSGSGPAYFYLVMEMLEQGAAKLGLPAELARVLTRQTALGAARLACDPAADLMALRAGVTSPGGTTAAAVSVLENSALREIFQRALAAARDRGAELGRLSRN